MDIAPLDRREEAAGQPASQPAAPPDDSVEPRGTPGSELHPVVYQSLLMMPIVILLASWLAFGKGRGIDVDLTMVFMVFLAFTAIPTLLFLAGRGNARRHDTIEQFGQSSVETASGPMTGRQAWAEIALVPAALAIAAILFGVASAVAG
jgi:uncharacterized membrane protein YdfJ with MMPL/SSD domain